MRRLEIGGVRWTVSSSVPLLPPGPGSPCLSARSSPPASSSGPAFRVHISTASPVLPAGVRRVADGGPWQLYALGSRRLIAWNGAAPGAPPAWSAEIDPDGRSAAVRVGRSRLVRRGRRLGLRNPLRYPLDQLLTLFALGPRGGLLLHAAGFVSHGRGLIFAGVSGAGKSTLTRLWLERHPRSALSDDRVVVRTAAAGRAGPAPVSVHGTPWPGDAGVASARGVPLGALCFLAKAPRTRIVPVPATQAMERLLAVTSILWADPLLMRQALAACERLVGSVAAFEFQFAPDASAASAIDELGRQGAIAARSMRGQARRTGARRP